MTAETTNVVRALAIQNSTLWKRGVHAENFQCNANRGYCANAVERAHTNSPDTNDKLIQTRPHEQNTITSRKWRFAMRKVHPLSGLWSRKPVIRLRAISIIRLRLQLRHRLRPNSYLQLYELLKVIILFRWIHKPYLHFPGIRKLVLKQCKCTFISHFCKIRSNRS